MKYLMVDIGNVICSLDFSNFIKELSQTVNISKEEAFGFLTRTQKLHDLGLTNLEEELQSQYSIRSQFTINKLQEEWNATITPNKIVIDWIVNQIENNEVKISLNSNIGIEHSTLMKTALAPIYKHKNVVKFFSCFVGARKPSLLYFKFFLEEYPEFKNCVYVDDNLENLKTGKWVKLNSFHFDLSKPEMQNEENIKNKLKEIEALI